MAKKKKKKRETSESYLKKTITKTASIFKLHSPLKRKQMNWDKNHLCYHWICWCLSNNNCYAIFKCFCFFPLIWNTYRMQKLISAQSYVYIDFHLSDFYVYRWLFEQASLTPKMQNLFPALKKKKKMVWLGAGKSSLVSNWNKESC